eukprot:TRINITY_DN31073_c0_g1_i1.p1 TRINITY_DN31073_c0_g1~~TRINITY_DN31073_c0_g1_i1.p1  ORF type:complete len:486 (-),score=155.96 TRINITY_DN31073_c0_g1_i1:146-1603(-)
MSSKGYHFKPLPMKDIERLLKTMGVHGVSQEVLEKPTGDIALGMYEKCTEFAYDMEVQQLKSLVPLPQFAEIYDEALETIIVLRCSRQLAQINSIEDFTWRDIWEPQGKRLRVLLSGLINFCKYKESMTVVITDLKAQEQALDANRRELVEISNQREQELAIASAKHNEELPAMWEAESQAQDLRSGLERLQKQKQTADRVVEDAEGKLRTCKEKVADYERQIEQLRDQASCLQSQVAESPEGLEQEIEELRALLGQKRAQVEAKGDEKRARAMRDQVLSRVQSHLENYVETLERGTQLRDQAEAAHERTARAEEELGGIKGKLETQCAEQAELEERVRHVTAEIEQAKQVHAERERELEDRRQAALQQHREIQAKRTDEQRAYHALQAQKLELEGELANARRLHEAQVAELLGQQRAITDSADAYAQGVDGLLQSCSGGMEASRQRYRRELLASPSPAKALRSPGRALRSPAYDHRVPMRSPGF